MAYVPIEDYGIIGNMRSVALVAINGSIDWFCFPHFDSPSLFASILDEKKGGHFLISPVQKDHKSKQFYWPDTNVLRTRFTVENAIVEITDFMPVGSDIKQEEDYRIIRRVRGVHGKIKMKVDCRPAFNYARDRHELEITGNGALFKSDTFDMGLVTNSLVFRYNHNSSLDGLSDKEGTFNICTFWLVEALTRAGRNDPGKLEQARLIFEQILGYANHVGMFSEEIGLGGEALGNTPQAFTHLSLISAAYNLNKALEEK